MADPETGRKKGCEESKAVACMEARMDNRMDNRMETHVKNHKKESIDTQIERRILVLGKNYSTPLGVIRSLGKTGYTVEMLYISKKVAEAQILEKCKYLSRLVIVNEENDRKVMEALKADFPARSVEYLLFPTDDYSASLIDRYREELRDYRMPHVIGDSVTRMMDKSVQNELATEVGFRTPREWIVSLEKEPVMIPEGIPYPCFIKPMVSAKGGKLGIRKCENREELEKGLAYMREKEPRRSILIQEFLEIRREYTIGGIADDQKIYIPALIRKKVIAQYNRGVTLCGVLTDNRKIGKCYDMILEYLRRVRYVGMFDLEILETADGYYFGELNLRCGGPSYGYFLGGVNLPKMTAELLFDGEVQMGTESAVMGTTFLNNKVVWEDYANLFISKKKLKNLYLQFPKTLLSDEEDPEPEKVFNRIMPGVFRKKRTKLRIKKFVPEKALQAYRKRKKK